MIKIGLTGGIGSGKSTVSNMLKEKGFTIIDADLVAREVLQIYPNIFGRIREKFGNSFFDESGQLKRRKFGNYLFASSDKMKDYENIIIPFIIKEILSRIKSFEEEGKEACVLDAATLIENNLHTYMDVNILVWVDYDTQIERVKLRDKLDEKQIVDRINSQMSLQNKAKVVQYTIDNSKSLLMTKKQLEDTLREIGKRFRGVKCLI